MSRIKWNDVGQRFYETGVKQGVFYAQNSDGTYPKGVAWNGLQSVSESPSGAEPTKLWADDTKYLELRSAEEFGATIEYFTYPEEFAKCNGEVEVAPGVYAGQQERTPFGFCYRTIVGNDTQKDAHGYKLHLVYGATAAPSEKGYTTVNDNPEAITFSSEITTTPLTVEGLAKPTATLVIDSRKYTTDEAKAKLKQLEDMLYGTDGSGTGNTGTDPQLPLPGEVINLLKVEEEPEGE